jgi:hypothetical protein
MSNEFVVMPADEAEAAVRHAAHLITLLAVEDDRAAYQRQVQRLALDGDVVWAASVAACAVQLAAMALAATPVDVRRQFLFDVIASSTPNDAADLNAEAGS